MPLLSEQPPFFSHSGVCNHSSSTHVREISQTLQPFISNLPRSHFNSSLVFSERYHIGFSLHTGHLFPCPYLLILDNGMGVEGDEASYKAKIKPEEEGYYRVYANLYDDYRLIDRDYDIIWVER